MSKSNENSLRSSFSRPARGTQPSLQPENKRRRFWRKSRRGVQWFASLGVVAYCVANLNASWQLHHELATVIQRREPLFFGELAPASVPDSQNAATVYLRAAAALNLTKAEEAALISKDALPDASLLAKNQVAITLARQAAQIPACRFPLDYEADNLAGILLPHLMQIRKLAYILRVQALWEARTGQAAAALDDVAVLFRMSEHLAPEPLLISGLTAIAIEQVGYRTLARVLADVELSPRYLQAYALRLPQTDWTAALHRDLMGERCFGLWAFQYASNPLQIRQLIYEPNSPGSPLLRRCLGAVWSPLWKLDEVQYLRAVERQSQAFLKPGTSMLAEDKMDTEFPWYAICTRAILPTLSRTGQKRDAMLAYRRMAIVALACNAYSATQGQYPPSLREAETVWGTPLPRDLYTGQAFLYRREGDEMRLYSVGPNRRDDGGKKADTQGANGDNSNAADDLTW